jgi:hypothetical protein
VTWQLLPLLALNWGNRATSSPYRHAGSPDSGQGSDLIRRSGIAGVDLRTEMLWTSEKQNNMLFSQLNID